MRATLLAAVLALTACTVRRFQRLPAPAADASREACLGWASYNFDGCSKDAQRQAALHGMGGNQFAAQMAMSNYLSACTAQFEADQRLCYARGAE